MTSRRRFWGLLAEPVGGETLRAFLVFSLLLVVLSGIAGRFLLKELSLQELARRLSLGQDEATRIAEAVAALGRDEGGINFHLLSQKVDVLRAVVAERLAERPFVRGVEVRDRFGGRLLYVSRKDLGLPRPPAAPEPGQGSVLTVSLMRGTRPEGVVRVEIADQELPREVQKLKASLRLKLAIATVVAVALLGVGLLYVLHLIRKNRELEQSRLAAERRSYLGLLASNLAHEIRNPLNAINMNLQMLEEELRGAPGLETSDYRELLEANKIAINSLDELANNFLALARPSEPKFEPRDLNEVLRSVATLLQADFRQSGVALETDFEPLLPTVDLDSSQFKQAVMNLLVNARQVLKGTGHVRLVSRAGASGEVVVEVRDDGPGIEEGVRERVFEVFFSKRGGGTGLGLPIARQIVERHGGTIEVESVLGHGATFRIRLPRRHPAAPTAKRPAPVTP